MSAIGRVLLIPKGTYNGSTVYSQLDWVRYDGKAWVCKVDGTVGIVPVEGANWTLLAQDGSVSGSVAWSAVTGKPFEDVDGTDIDVNGDDKIYLKRSTFGTVRVKNGATVTDLEASGDSTIQIEAGNNVTITADDTATPKKLVINSSGGGGGGASELNDLDDVTITGTPTQGQTLIANSSGVFENQPMPQGGHTMIPIYDSQTGLTDIETIHALNNGNDNYVINAYSAKRWSNCEAKEVMTTASQDADGVGTWEDDATWESGSRSGWLWSSELYRVLEDENGNTVLDIDISPVFDIGKSETVGLLSYRVDDNYPRTIDGVTVNGGCVAFKFTGAIKNANGVKVGLKLVHQRTEIYDGTILT